MNCSRTVCQAPLNRGHYLIWNEPSTGVPNTYCPKCGRKIIEHNKHDTLKLKYEIIKP